MIFTCDYFFIEQHYLRDAVLPVVNTRGHMGVVKFKDITGTYSLDEM